MIHFREHPHPKEALIEVAFFNSRHGGIILKNRCWEEFSRRDARKWIDKVGDIMFKEIWKRIEKML